MPESDGEANANSTAPTTTPLPTSKKRNTSSQTPVQPSESSLAVDPAMTPIFKYLPSSVQQSARKGRRDQGAGEVAENANVNDISNSTSTHSTIVVVTPKRSDYVSWDDYFLAVAVLSSKRSKDSNLDDAEGACIVDPKNRIVAVGYSGFPRGCPDTVFPWNDHKDMNDDEKPDWLHTKQPYITHAITNAILNKCSPTVEGCKIYVMKFPSSDSAKMIIQSGITEVVIIQKKNHDGNDEKEQDDGDNGDDDGHLGSVDAQAASTMLNMANVHVRYHRPVHPSITLDFQHGGNVGESNNTDQRCCHDRDHKSDSNEEEIEKEDEEIAPKSFTDEEQAAAKILLDEANYDASTVIDNGRRTDAISWNDYFMSVAFLTAQRSKDPNTQVGACIVDNDKRIVGLGYNGMPSGLSDDDMPWARENTAEPLFNKYMYVCHAEVNAILNKGSADVKGSTLYVALFPCENCAKMIIQAGIKKVVYLKDSYHNTPGATASRIMLKCAGVALEQYTPSMDQLTIRYY